MNLTNIGLAQALFKKEKREAKNPFSLEKKREVLKSIVGKSTRQAAKIIWVTFDFACSTISKPINKPRWTLNKKLCQLGIKEWDPTLKTAAEGVWKVLVFNMGAFF